jgi:hypothetical protein
MEKDPEVQTKFEKEIDQDDEVQGSTSTFPYA